MKAYCKIHQTVQPGFVVSYDPTNAIYLIEFEDEVHGYEFCPDSDVATSGIPNILIKKSKYYRRDEFESSFSQLQGMCPRIAMLYFFSFDSQLFY